MGENERARFEFSVSTGEAVAVSGKATAKEAAIYWVLRSYRNPESGMAWPKGNTVLAELASMGETMFRGVYYERLNSLERKGLIERSKRGRLRDVAFPLVRENPRTHPKDTTCPGKSPDTISPGKSPDTYSPGKSPDTRTILLNKTNEPPKRESRSRASRLSPKIDYADFLSCWNEAAKEAGFTPARSMTPKRKKALDARWKDKDWRESYLEAIEKLKASRFATGGKGWKANIEWFLRPDTATRILEGSFDELFTETGKRSATPRYREDGGKFNGR